MSKFISRKTEKVRRFRNFEPYIRRGRKIAQSRPYTFCCLNSNEIDILLSNDPGARFSKVPELFGPEKAIRKITTCVFC